VSAGKQGGIIMKKGSLLQLHLDFSRTVLKLPWKSGRRKLLANPPELYAIVGICSMSTGQCEVVTIRSIIVH
jgi:hypothetical protein